MRWKLVLLSLFAICLSENAQQPVLSTTSNTSPAEHTLSVTVDRVNVLFTVAAKSGKLVSKLSKDDFAVYEDGQLQNISNFSKEADLPLNIALVIDTSGSVRDKLRFEREAAIRFFESSIRAGKDKALVMAFDTRVELLQDYTDNLALLKQAVNRTLAGGSTSLYDGISQAAARRRPGVEGRQVIIVLSDGMDNSSHVSVKKAIEDAQKNDIVIYAISTNRIEDGLTRNPPSGDSNLAQLATETGGRVLLPRKVDDLVQSFYRIRDEIRAQYSLAYGPTNTRRDGTYRKIQILPARRGYTIRCRHGYFAPGMRS
jgi:Ca-activated chloride channel family protein